MKEPVWLLRRVIDAMHDMQLAEHGGAAGVRDESLLESALAKPQNAWHYGNEDLCVLAAAYAYGICRNHPYVDGNKRTAFLAAFTFLSINGLQLMADEVSATNTMLRLAAGDMSQKDFAEWLQKNSKAT